MAKLRTITFGYMIQNGRVAVDLDEAKTVRNIFERYTQGATLQTIADDLVCQGVPFFLGKVRWNKNTIKRIIENEKYVGNEIYEPIITPELFCKVNEKRKERSRPTVQLSREVKHLKEKCCCGQCGARYKRINTWGTHEKWMCAHGCRCDRFIDDQFLLDSIKDIIEAVICDPGFISISTYSAYVPSKEVQREENELIYLLEQPQISFMSSAKSILRAASLRFQCCRYDRGEMTARLQEEIADYVPCEENCSPQIYKFIKWVKIYPNGIITSVFFNGAEVSAAGGTKDGDGITKTRN